MRLRHVIMKLDSPVRDFTNNVVDHMVLAGENPKPTHKNKGGWRYRIQIVEVSGLPALQMDGRHKDHGEKRRFFPATGIKELNPWTAEDDAEEKAELEARAAADSGTAKLAKKAS